MLFRSAHPDRAVFNLVLNALQAVEVSGGVHVTVHRAARETHHVPGTAIAAGVPLVAITVSDDGVGIPEDLRERLFEPFVSGKSGGTGLGLPVVHRAVEAHRGVVLVDTLARGTRFTVLLPAIAVGRPGGGVSALLEDADSSSDAAWAASAFPMPTPLGASSLTGVAP